MLKILKFLEKLPQYHLSFTENVVLIVTRSRMCFEDAKYIRQFFRPTFFVYLVNPSYLTKCTPSLSLAKLSF